MLESVEEIYDYASDNNPTALQAQLQLKSSKMQYLMAKGRMLPSISFSAGVSTNYYENLKGEQNSLKGQLNNLMHSEASLRTTGGNTFPLT